MSGLIKHAERELKLAGLLDEDGDYGGMVGEAVLQLVKTFAAQGHSGYSAQMTLAAFNIVANYRQLTPLKDPILTGEYIEYIEGRYQSTRVSSVFSNDKGHTWYDINKKVPWWKRIFGVRKAYIKFADEDAE